MTPLAAISQPTSELRYDEGELITIDGAGSQVPAGSQIWFGVMEDGSDNPLVLTYSTTGLQGSFTASAAVSAYRIRLVIAEAGAMPDDTALRSTTIPCAASAQCSAAEVLISRKSVRARIDAPASGELFTDGQQIAIDGGSSEVPSGFQIWLGVLVEDQTSPMATVYTGSALQGSFTASEAVESYLIRLVIATPEDMPDDTALRSSILPCRLTSTCDSTQVRIHQPYGFEVVYSFPDVTLLRWRGVADPQVESVTYPDSQYDEWVPPDCGSGGDYYLRDFDYECSFYAEGADDYYRIKSGYDPDWSYLGGGASPGQRVIRPGWSAPKIVPYFEDAASSVSWDLPDGALPSLGQGSLSLLLKGQSEQSLGGTTIRVYVNEDTFQVKDGIGQDIISGGGGFDQPACMVESSSPDLSVDVRSQDDEVTIEVPGIVYGANSLRFEVSGAGGGYSERAIIAPIHEQLSAPGTTTYSDLMPLLFGDELGNPEPVLDGLGPASRFSADCGDSDQSLEPGLREHGAQYHAWLQLTRPDSGDTTQTLIQTGSDGRWSAALGSFTPGETVELAIDIDTCGGTSPLQLGRRIMVPSLLGGGADPVKDLRWSICGRQSLAPQPLLVTATGVNPAPSLAFLPDAVYGTDLASPSRPEEVDKRIDLRIVDSYHDVDLESVMVTNLSLDPAVSVRAYYAADQLRPQGSWGWMVATLPMLAPADNLIEITATDLNGGTMSETRTVTFREPEVMAVITSPADGSAWRSYSTIPLDGSGSQGENGLEGRWVFFSGADDQALPDLEQSGLGAAVVMPHGYGGFTARLVVAEPGWLPTDLYTADLPCSINAGDGKCDSVEIDLVNACCPSPDTACYGDDATGLSLSVLTPLHGEAVPADETVQLSAEMSGGSGSYVYRWWLAPADSPEDRTLLTPDGDDAGFDPSYATWVLDPEASGLDVGSYIVTVEAGYIESTEGCIAGLREASATLFLVHAVKAVAPGQVVVGESIRVYGSTFIPGTQVLILIDDDLNDEESPYEAMVVVEEGRFFDIALATEMSPTVYYVAAAEPDGSGQSIWRQALDVVSPAYQVSNEEDESCGGPGTDCAHSIIAGQTVTGSWGVAGDTDYFHFVAAPGASYDVVLERADNGLSDYHPDSPDPELMIADPDGMVDSITGYANDNSADDSNARISGFSPKKAGVHLIVCRSYKGSGEYSLTLTQTGAPSSSDFTVVPYGSRAVNVVDSVGDPATASLQALVIDPRGYPVGGAYLDWAVQEGAVNSSLLYTSSPDGIGQADFTLDASGTAAMVAGFTWPALKNLKLPERKPARGAEPGPVAGFLQHDENHAVRPIRLADPNEVTKMRESWYAMPPVDEHQAPREAEKADSDCPDIDLRKQKIQRIALPENAVSVETITLEITDQAGLAISDPVTGAAVTELVDLQLRLVGTFLDENGVPFDQALPGVQVLVEVAGIKPDYTHGVMTPAGYCRNALIPTAGELEPFQVELGTRSIYSHVNDQQQIVYSPIELVVAATRVKVRDANGVWKWPSADTAIEVAPEPGEPNAFYWLQEKDFLFPKMLGRTLVSTGGDKWAFSITGPGFCLFDEFNNFVAGWGANDSLHHYDQAGDEIYIARGDGSVMTSGTAPWQTLDYSPASNPVFYTVHEYVTDEALLADIDPGSYVEPPHFFGTSAFQLCLNTNAYGTVCDNASLTNSSPFNVLVIQAPALDDKGNEIPAYVSETEYANPDNLIVSPGQPLTFKPGGEPLLVRVEPVQSDDRMAPHDQILVPRTDPVTTRIWVSGPVGGEEQLRFTREDPAQDVDFPEVQDVEICTGSFDVTTEEYTCCIGYVDTGTGSSCTPSPSDPTCVCSGWTTCLRYNDFGPGGCTDFSTGSATLDTFTDIGGEMPAAGEAVNLPVFGISKTPAKPGWYTVVAGTDDLRFSTMNEQGRDYATFSFRVLGGKFLDEDQQPYGEIINVPDSTPVGLYIELPAGDNPLSSIQVDVVSRAEDDAGLGSVAIPLSLSHISGRISVYFTDAGIIQLYPQDSQPASGFQYDLPVATGGTLTASHLGTTLVSAWIDTDERPVDLDIDSDNDEGTAIPSREPTEDWSEASASSNPTGKFVFVNHNDDDYDGIPDYADLANPAEGTLVPIVLEIKPDASWDLVSIRFEYDGSDALQTMAGTPIPDPRNGQATQFLDFNPARQVDAGGGLVLRPALRIWRIPSPEVTRTADAYIIPGQQYGAIELGFSDSTTERVFYLEGLNAIPQASDPDPTLVTVVATIDGSGYTDEVLVTVVEANLGVNNSSNRPDLRPGVPDADFNIDADDEMVEDQQQGLLWWRARSKCRDGNVVPSWEFLVDFIPALTTTPPVVRTAGFEFFLRIHTDQHEDVVVLPDDSVGPLLNFLRDDSIAVDVLWRLDYGYCNLSIRDCSIELTGDKTKLLLLDRRREVEVQQPAEVWIDLLAKERNGHDKVVVDSIKITIQEIEDFYWLGSLRGDPETPYDYVTEDNRTVEVLHYPFVQQLTSVQPDPEKSNYLFFVHGYKNSIEKATYYAGELYKRVFWAGYRGNFGAVTWEGDELGILFDPNVENAFQTSPAMLDFLGTYVPNVWGVPSDRINIMVHSLGNLVVFDALRLYHTAHPMDVPGDIPPPLVNNVISIEAAVWEETFWEQQSIVYTDPPEWAIEYDVDDLMHHSWAFWFNQERHPVRQALNRLFISHVTADSALVWMKRNDVAMRSLYSDAFFRLTLYGTHDYRVPASDGSDVEYGGTADLWHDIPALLRPPFRPKLYFPSDITDPLGMTQAPPAFAFDVFAEDFHWRPDEHSDHIELPYCIIFPWYEHLTTAFPRALPREEE